MAQENRAQIKTYFETGDVPTQSQFANSFDSQVFWQDDVETDLTSNSDSKVPTVKAVVDGIAAIPVSPLADVLDQGNTSGANDIVFDASQGLQFNNSSKLREGTTDAGLGGNKGIAQVCSLDYELKWEAGRLYVMQQYGTTIRQSLYNFTTTPTATDDSTKGYAVGSLWTLDDGTTYECIDATPTSADWIESSQSKFIEVTKAQLSALEGAGTLTLNVWYRVTDALANTAKILVSALSTSVVSKAAVNLTNNSFGEYTLSSDTYVAISGGSGILKATASGTDTYTATITGVTSYTDGDTYLVRFTNGNTTGATLNINSLGAKTLYRNNDGAIIGGDIWGGGEMLCVYNSTLNGFQCIGTSPNSIFAYVTNADSVTITKGQVVYAFGGTGDRMTVKLANNSSDATSARTVGVVLSASIGVNQKGIIILQGLLDGLSTLGSPFVDGDIVYLGSTNGSITRTKQYAPNHLVYIGTVTTASAGSAGRMYVKIQNGYEMDELHNVSAQTPANKDGLFYNTTTNLWESRQVAATDINANVSNIEFGYLDGVTSAIQTQINGKENTITAGTTSQYYRGDKTFQTLDKTAVGLGNVDNTSDANKPISSATQTALNGKENTITAGTTSQYYRGDKTFQTLDKTAVGLSNVDNTSDANKPISTATQTALNAKVDTFTMITQIGTWSAPAASTTYYAPIMIGIGIPLTSVTTFLSAFSFATKIVGIYVQHLNSSGVQGSSQNVAIQIRNNTTSTSTQLINIQTNQASGVQKNFEDYTLNVSIAANDSIALQINTPAWTTLPTNAVIRVTLFFQRT